MVRLLILLGLLLVAALLVRRWLRNLKVGVNKLDRSRNVPTVRCAHCGLFLPRAQAWTENNEYFCCREHARSGSARDKS